jgi:hypothetical protein
LVKTAAFGDDGHTLCSAGGLPIWSPIVDRYLASNNLVLRDRLINAERAPPSRLNTRGRDTFKSHLDGGPNKAFVIGGDRTPERR